LSPEVAGRIAAGEVIERPASVVKELIENALDAGAGRIEVLIEGGGLDLIRVSDDGCGIPSDQVELAFERHGTSKLRSDADLERLTTLGFRGEALPSIAAVAEVLCQTRASREAVGVSVRLGGGRLLSREPFARQSGTTVGVEDLFAELPARRKFLRTRSGEASLIGRLVGYLALARPDVAFRLVSDEHQAFATSGDGDLRSAALAVLGAAFARGAIPLGPVEMTDASGQLVARLSGLLGPTQEQRGNRGGLGIFVNGRWVQSRALSHAVEEGYRTAIQTGRYPVAVVFIEVPPRAVDVNVHPAKSEVRLLAEREIYGALRDAVRSALPATQPLWDGQASEDELAQLAFSSEGLRVLGQVGATYIVAEGALGLYLVDQHAAHERALLEELRESRANGLERQQLLTPEVVELPPLAGLEPEEVCTALADLGFEAEPFGDETVLVRALPALLAERRALAGLEEALEAVADARRQPDWRERLSVELACKTAIRAGETLPAEEMQALLRSLGEARLSQACAHGRPTSLLLSHDQLARQFGRS
jgi:DNA mismatch repair protein MutL